MKHSDLTTTNGTAALGPSAARLSLLASAISRLKASLACRAAATATLPPPPVVPVGLAAALTLSVSTAAHAIPRHAPRDPAVGTDAPVQIVVSPQQKPIREPAARPEFEVGEAPCDWVTPESLAAALMPMRDGPRFVRHAGIGRVDDAWAGIFACAEGPSLMDFATGNSAIARLVQHANRIGAHDGADSDDAEADAGRSGGRSVA